MKIALIIDTWFPAIGGGQINAYEISRRLAKKDTRIDVITRNCGKDNLKTNNYLKIYKLGPKSKPNSSMSKIIFLIRLFFFILSRDYDLMHVHPFLPSIVAKLISIYKNTPLIITVHGTRLFEEEKITPSRLLEKYILTGIKYDAQISVTKTFSKIPNINKKIFVIPNAINVEKFSKIKATKFKKPTILWVGRFDPVKRVKDLILSAQYISNETKNFQIMLVGYGYEEDKLRKLVKTLNLKNVIFAGKKTGQNLVEVYKKSSLFVLPSASEGQPISVLEAKAASLPIVATNVGGISEIVQNGQEGFLVHPKNPKKLAEAILKILKNQNKYNQKLQENNKNLHNWDEVAKMTKRVYSQSARFKN